MIKIIASLLLFSITCQGQSTYDGPELQRLKSDTAYARKYNEQWDQFVKEHTKTSSEFWFPVIESDESDAIILIKTDKQLPYNEPISRIGFKCQNIWVIQNENYIVIITDTTNWKERWKNILQPKLVK